MRQAGMTVPRAYKTELALNDRQMAASKRHAGAARYAYNWGLARKQEAYKATGKRPSAIDLHRELNALKKTELPWMYAVSTCAPQEALRNLDNAFAHCFRRCTLKQEGKLKGKLGYPQRKTKKKGLGSFHLTGFVVVSPDAIQLPRLGRLRLKEHGYLPSAGVKILSATVSEQAGALVRLGPGGAGTSGAYQHWPGSGRRPGHQDARDLLGWHRYSQSQAPQASDEEAQ